jgi:hypothetical protein
MEKESVDWSIGQSGSARREGEPGHDGEGSFNGAA